MCAPGGRNPPGESYYSLIALDSPLFTYNLASGKNNEQTNYFPDCHFPSFNLTLHFKEKMEGLIWHSPFVSASLAQWKRKEHIHFTINFKRDIFKKICTLGLGKMQYTDLSVASTQNHFHYKIGLLDEYLYCIQWYTIKKKIRGLTLTQSWDMNGTWVTQYPNEEI